MSGYRTGSLDILYRVQGKKKKGKWCKTNPMNLLSASGFAFLGYLDRGTPHAMIKGTPISIDAWTDQFFVWNLYRMYCFNIPFLICKYTIYCFIPFYMSPLARTFPSCAGSKGCSGLPSQVSDRRIHGPFRFEVQLLHSCESRNFRAFFLRKHRVWSLPFRLWIKCPTRAAPCHATAYVCFSYEHAYSINHMFFQVGYA
jgi:hypothetical protein